MSAVTTELRYNTTASGECACGNVTTISGLGAPEPSRYALGDPIPVEAGCLTCGAPLVLVIVGHTLAPFVATAPDEEDG